MCGQTFERRHFGRVLFIIEYHLGIAEQVPHYVICSFGEYSMLCQRVYLERTSNPWQKRINEMPMDQLIKESIPVDPSSPPTEQ